MSWSVSSLSSATTFRSNAEPCCYWGIRSWTRGGLVWALAFPLCLCPRLAAPLSLWCCPHCHRRRRCPRQSCRTRLGSPLRKRTLAAHENVCLVVVSSMFLCVCVCASQRGRPSTPHVPALRIHVSDDSESRECDGALPAPRGACDTFVCFR